MEVNLSTLLNPYFSHSDLVGLLLSEGDQMQALFARANQIKSVYTGSKTYLRGLIEFANLCDKDCYYCGIRHSNHAITRYTLPDTDILAAVRMADQYKLGSIVLQSGEQSSAIFVDRITNLLHSIDKATQGRIAVTLCVGEQTDEVYLKWFEAGAKRYLLRIETTNPLLYRSIHPQNKLHDYYRRLDCLYSLKRIGYQTGTGVMIGLPGQSVEDLADDLLFFEEFGIDMVGMGPYIESANTPLAESQKEKLLPLKQRYELSLKMIAALRLLMRDINIAATTALETINPQGKVYGLQVGANVIMPNLTPAIYINRFQLYDNKPVAAGSLPDYLCRLESHLQPLNLQLGYGESGTSAYFESRKQFEANC